MVGAILSSLTGLRILRRALPTFEKVGYFLSSLPDWKSGLFSCFWGY